jgi:guanosine-3',5'-bis(diphosphate) 3'-pyrophosphohydrolase
LSRSSDTNVIIKAANFAAFKHRNQRRKDADASPYINHPLALADVLANEAGISDPVTICAALLHDTIGDTKRPWNPFSPEYPLSKGPK